MWETAYEDRFADWVRLRHTIQLLDPSAQLLAINNWWFCAPIVNKTITWPDRKNWPDPWQLLTNNGYCDLARALGIVYTIMLTEQLSYTELTITQTKQDNLVLVNGGKYILNWAPGEMLNIHSTPIITVKNTIDSSELRSFLQ
jgi:hypothetical protein